MAVNKVRRNGSFAPLSARYYMDDAVATAGEKAELLYVRGLAFCADTLSDGFITDVQLARFVGAGLTAVPTRAKKLCQVGLWERVEGDLLGGEAGYRVVAWLKHNRSRAEIEAAMRADSNRKARGRDT
jgi:hypothetical protein